mgnify:CR=1 FL=1
MINIEGREEKHGDDKTQCEPSLLWCYCMVSGFDYVEGGRGGGGGIDSDNVATIPDTRQLAVCNLPRAR